jgi:hypothetical protein
VLAVGMMGFISSTKTSMSSGAVSNMYCCCEVRIFDYYGNIKVTDDMPAIRVQTYEQHTDAACANRCDAHYGKNAQASGHAC